MKVLLVTNSMEMGGIERSVVEIARELQNRGHAAWVVSSGGHLERDLERNRTPHVRAPLLITSPPGVVQSALLLRRLIREYQVDLVHSFSATASIALNLGFRLGAAGTVRLVSSPMGLQNSPREPFVVTWLRNVFLRWGARRILVISPEIRRHLKLAGARDADLLDFSFVGLDVASFQASEEDAASVRREFSFPPEAKIVSTIGALAPRKSHELFVEAAAAVGQRLPEARFLVVGGGELRAPLEQLAAQRDLDGRLVFTGVRDDISRLLAATDVYVKPGVVEGYIGVTVLEALALGKPVVAFDTEDVKLALRHGETGRIVANGDWRALADTVEHLLRHPEEGHALGAKGARLVREQFDLPRIAERLEAFYESVLGARPAAAQG